MHLSILLLTVGLAAVAIAQDSLLEEYRDYVAQSRITYPGPGNDTVSFRNLRYNRESIRWSLPSNVTAPNMTRFHENLSQSTEIHLVYKYRTEEDDTPEDNGNNTASARCSLSVGGISNTTFGGSHFISFLGDMDFEKTCVDELVEALEDLSGWDDVSDLRGGKRFWFRLLITPFFRSEADDVESMEHATLESTKFDIEAEGYTPGQDGSEWSSSHRVERPVMLVGVVAAAVGVWML